MKTANNTNSQYPQMPYDLIREMFVALGIMGVLVVVLAAVFSTPDVPALTAKQVSQQAPKLLVQTALDDLSGQDPISTYGPPYSNTPGAAQHLGPISPQQWAGVTLPINSAQDEVIGPLTHIVPVDPNLKAVLQTWNSATSKQQTAWAAAADKVLNKATVTSSNVQLPGSASNYGPVPQILNAYLALAHTGLLESAIDGRTGPMPALNRTKSLLLLQDQPDAQYAAKLDMTGDEWGIIKETGNYPGAVWLWYYTMLYQIPPFSSSDSADLLVVLTTFAVTLILMLTPFIPGLRSVPRWIGIYRLIWRKHYQSVRERSQ
ncbi:hypothetical protein LLE49_05840 [Alicyclobacillus tolerans]|uniref:hypothetical protein n=1 Tax=Alicyclobacillus tolerans TaxID=90970 RepID=UPI001F32EA57|nr:hypothetical protein [Alicyclobacillus tolerans]MCF8564263.1 hypothetical protein [Alicyclobacillus tolerans]